MLLICIADISMLICFTILGNIPHVLGKQNLLKQQTSNGKKLLIFLENNHFLFDTFIGLKLATCSNLTIFTNFRMCFFGAAHGWGAKRLFLPKICHTYPTIIKLGTLIPYLKKIQEIYKSRDTTSEFC